MSVQGRLKRLRNKIPDMECLPGCHDCCGPVVCSEEESRRLPLSPPLKGLTCGYLINEKCAVYQERPFICRLFGTAPGLQCPHGCAPDSGLMSAEQEADLNREYQFILKRQ